MNKEDIADLEWIYSRLTNELNECLDLGYVLRFKSMIDRFKIEKSKDRAQEVEGQTWVNDAKGYGMEGTPKRYRLEIPEEVPKKYMCCTEALKADGMIMNHVVFGTVGDPFVDCEIGTFPVLESWLVEIEEKKALQIAPLLVKG